MNKSYDFIMECVSENYIDHSLVGARNNEDAVGILKIVSGIFDGLKLEILDVFAEGEMVATRILYDVVHSEECMGFL